MGLPSRWDLRRKLTLGARDADPQDREAKLARSAAEGGVYLINGHVRTPRKDARPAKAPDDLLCGE